MSGRVLLVALAATFCVACTGPGPGSRPIPVGSLERFESRVQPHVTERCASGGCHGRPERPLALFAPGAYRENPERTYLDEPLDRWELEENMRRLAAFALAGDAEDSLAIRKPLALEAGGVWHGGGDVFMDVRDPACLALSGWLAAPAPVAADGGAP